MDFIQQLGIVALASRLKRLTERMLKEGDKVYISQKIPFQPRWFTTYSLLSQSSKPLSVTEIAETVGLSHPAVIQITRDMIKQGILITRKDPLDGRRRLLTLSLKGKKLLPRLETIWLHFEEATREIFDEVGFDFLAAIEQLERSFERQEMGNRIISRIKKQQYEAIEIVNYNSDFKLHFQRLNEEWLEKYFNIEDYDKKVLTNPETEILAKGGFIFFARLNNKIVGTAALIKINDQIYELAKMAVTESAQGKQVGKKLCDTIINKARSLGAQQIVLMTDRKLGSACELYQKMGFQITSGFTPGAADVKRARHGMAMRLELCPNDHTI